MTKKEARRLVSVAAAASLEADIDLGAEFLFFDEQGNALNAADAARVTKAAEELATFLRRRVEPRKR